MKSFYLLATNMMEAESFLGSWIWKLQTLPRIQMFIWRCMHNSIGVKECLANRGIPLDTSCPLCHNHAESISHALWDCHVVKPLWHQLGFHNSSSIFFSQNIKTWLTSNANSRSTRNIKGVPWHFLFPFAIWLIWKQQNQVVFNNKGVNPNLVKVITMQATEYVLYVTQPRYNNRMAIRQVRWEKPNLGQVKLNTDRSSDASSSIAGGGGLIRDEQGNWVIGFTRKIGKANSFLAEIWALRDGLILCNQLDLNAVMVELDAKALVDALNNPFYVNSIISSLFDDCRQLVAQIPHLSIKHIYCEANRCADRLANLGSCQSLDFISYSFPPVDLVPLVAANCQRLYFDRLCPILLLSRQCFLMIIPDYQEKKMKVKLGVGP